MSKICVVVGAARFDELKIQEGAFVISADGGFSALKGMGIIPDLAVGDFDSLGYVPTDVRIVKHPVEKDDTDTMLAVREGMSAGCDTFYIYGGMGGRLDHTLANIQVLQYLSVRGFSGFLFGEGRVVTAVTDGVLAFDGERSGIVSVFCMGSGAEGVFLDGLKYPLSNATLAFDFPLGVSNEFTKAPATVRVDSGTLVVTWEDDTLSCVDRLPRTLRRVEKS